MSKSEANAPKFKVGDKVVTITQKPFADVPIGTRAVIQDISPGKIGLRLDRETYQICLEENIELEVVYNSPLYKALL